jgi:hypothetical protein
MTINTVNSIDIDNIDDNVMMELITKDIDIENINIENQNNDYSIKNTKYLSVINSHPRDKTITFEDVGHKYTITCDPDSKYTSVTTWVHYHFEKFDADKIIERMKKSKNWNTSNKYYYMTDEEIKNGWNKNREEVSGAGTQLHYEIECFMNYQTEVTQNTHNSLFAFYEKNITNIKIPLYESIEWSYFIDFIKSFPKFKPYRTEWTVFHEDVKLCGTIDMVYEADDGTLQIYDWKRCKDITKTSNWNKYAITDCISHLPDTNFWQYTLQLNAYKKIIEDKYNKKVSAMYLVKLHPNNSKKSFELYKVPFLELEMKMLFMNLKDQVTLTTNNNID